MVWFIITEYVSQHEKGTYECHIVTQYGCHTRHSNSNTDQKFEYWPNESLAPQLALANKKNVSATPYNMITPKIERRF